MKRPAGSPLAGLFIATKAPGAPFMGNEPPTTRRDLGALLAPVYGPKWSARLQELLGWSPKTVDRLGSKRFPLDVRRLTIMAECIRERNPQVSAAEEIAQWCEKRIELAQNSDQPLERNAQG